MALTSVREPAGQEEGKTARHHDPLTTTLPVDVTSFFQFISMMMVSQKKLICKLLLPLHSYFKARIRLRGLKSNLGQHTLWSEDSIVFIFLAIPEVDFHLFFPPTGFVHEGPHRPNVLKLEKKHANITYLLVLAAESTHVLTTHFTHVSPKC